MDATLKLYRQTSPYRMVEKYFDTSVDHECDGQTDGHVAFISNNAVERRALKIARAYVFV